MASLKLITLLVLAKVLIARVWYVSKKKEKGCWRGVYEALEKGVEIIDKTHKNMYNI